MTENSATPQTRVPTPAWLHAARALLLIAMVGAGYLAWVSIHHGPAAGCGPASGCSAVLQSRWAYWLGLPVSLPAVFVYFALFGATILLQKNPAPDDQRGAWAAIIILSVVVAGAAFWFVSLQVFVIQSFCKYCLTAHACGFAAGLLCLMNIPYATEPDTPMWATGSGKRGIPRQAMLSLLLIGLAGVAALAGGQILVQKERNVVKVPNQQATAGTNQLTLQAASQAADLTPPSPNARLIAPRVLSLYSNEFILKFDELPMLGSPDAPQVIVCLVDYTCIHCRALHSLLTRVSQQFSNQLGIVCLPVTLSPVCNPYIPKMNAQANTNACEYARLGLAVWRAKPAVHRQFDDWMLAGSKPPPLDQARARAVALLGADKLESALTDPWVAKQLQIDCRLHHANLLSGDNGELPQIVMGDAISFGPLNSVEHLQILLRQHLGLNLVAK